MCIPDGTQLQIVDSLTAPGPGQQNLVILCSGITTLPKTVPLRLFVSPSRNLRRGLIPVRGRAGAFYALGSPDRSADERPRLAGRKRRDSPPMRRLVLLAILALPASRKPPNARSDQCSAPGVVTTWRPPDRKRCLPFGGSDGELYALVLRSDLSERCCRDALLCRSKWRFRLERREIGNCARVEPPSSPKQRWRPWLSRLTMSLP